MSSVIRKLSSGLRTHGIGYVFLVAHNKLMQSENRVAQALRPILIGIHGWFPYADHSATLQPVEMNEPLAAHLKELGGRLKSQGAADLAKTAHELAVEAVVNPFNVAPLCHFVEALSADGRVDDYRDLIQNIDLLMFFRARHKYLHDFTDYERETYVDIALKCAQMPESIASTVRFVEYVIKNDIPGDFVECGVWLGASPYVIAKTLMRLGRTDRRIFMYDTYEGFPYGEPIDVPYSPNQDLTDVFRADAEYRSGGGGSGYSGSSHMRSTVDETRANVERSGYPSDKLIFVKGLVEDTIPAHIPDQIAILRLDTDHYRSTKHELEHLYPRLSRGGVLIIDDYGFYLGAKRATDEYFEERGMPLCLFRIDEHVRATFKP